MVVRCIARREILLTNKRNSSSGRYNNHEASLFKNKDLKPKLNITMKLYIPKFLKEITHTYI